MIFFLFTQTGLYHLREILFLSQNHSMHGLGFSIVNVLAGIPVIFSLSTIFGFRNTRQRSQH